MIMTNQLQLFCGSIKVGHIHDQFCSDETWFGRFEPSIKKEDGLQENRIMEFIHFSQLWNERVATNPSNPPDASEFDQFNDLIATHPWFVESNDAKCAKIAEAPIFVKGEISWRLYGS
jgi:hypothetical protein